MKNQEQHFGAVSRVLLYLAGVDAELMQLCANSTAMKYAAGGFLILIPALLATVSGFYFIWTMASSHPYGLLISFAAGLLWGGIIFSLDRYLVMSVKNTGGFWHTLCALENVTRVLLGGVINFVIAQPLVLALFSGTIAERLYADHQRELQTLSNLFEQKIESLNHEIKGVLKETSSLKSAAVQANQAEYDGDAALQDHINLLSMQITDANNELIDEIAGKGRTLRPKDGPVAKSIAAKIKYLETQQKDLLRQQSERLAQHRTAQNMRQDILIKEQDNLDAQRRVNFERMTKLQEAVKALNTEKLAALQALEKKQSSDVLASLKTLYQLEKEDDIVFWADVLLIAMLFGIDTMALLLKIAQVSSDNNDDDYNAQLRTQRFIHTQAAEINATVFRATEEMRTQYGVKMEELKAKYQHTVLDVKVKSDILAEVVVYIEQSVKAHSAMHNSLNSRKNSLDEKSIEDIVALFEQVMARAMEDFFASVNA